MATHCTIIIHRLTDGGYIFTLRNVSTLLCCGYINGCWNSAALQLFSHSCSYQQKCMCYMTHFSALSTNGSYSTCTSSATLYFLQCRIMLLLELYYTLIYLFTERSHVHSGSCQSSDVKTLTVVENIQLPHTLMSRWHLGMVHINKAIIIIIALRFPPPRISADLVHVHVAV